MSVIVSVQLPNAGGFVTIRNAGPTSHVHAHSPGGERWYEWEANGVSGRVKHNRRDGWPRLLAIVFLDMAERGDAYPAPRYEDDFIDWRS